MTLEKRILIDTILRVGEPENKYPTKLMRFLPIVVLFATPGLIGWIYVSLVLTRIIEPIITLYTAYLTPFFLPSLIWVILLMYYSNKNYYIKFTPVTTGVEITFQEVISFLEIFGVSHITWNNSSDLILRVVEDQEVYQIYGLLKDLETLSDGISTYLLKLGLVHGYSSYGYFWQWRSKMSQSNGKLFILKHPKYFHKSKLLYYLRRLRVTLLIIVLLISLFCWLLEIEISQKLLNACVFLLILLLNPGVHLLLASRFSNFIIPQEFVPIFPVLVPYYSYHQLQEEHIYEQKHTSHSVIIGEYNFIRAIFIQFLEYLRNERMYIIEKRLNLTQFSFEYLVKSLDTATTK